jgi:hypothetical protein
MAKELDLLKQYIDISQLPVGWEDDWHKSQASFPGNDLFFLQKPFIQEAGEMSGLSPDAIQALNYAAEKLSTATGIPGILWHAHFLFFKEEQYPRDAILPFLNIRGMEEKVLSLIYVFILFSGYPEMKKNYQDKGISEQILRDTLLDIAIWMDDFKTKNGYWGFKALGWLMNHLQCKLFRIGRLQFMPAVFEGDIRVYRNITTQKIMVYSEPGIQYRADGLINGTNDIFENDGIWTSSLEESGDCIRGILINSQAHAVNHLEEISLSDYELVLTKGNPIMEVHIPAGQPLKHEDCFKSYQAALSFYDKFFPEVQFNGFCCTSWLLDNQLSLLLPAKSNIVQFQQDYFMYPYKGTDSQTFERVFGGKSADLAKAPRNTPLQAAILDYCLQGNNMRMGAGFILKEWIIQGKKG